MRILFVGQVQPPGRSWQRAQEICRIGSRVVTVDVLGKRDDVSWIRHQYDRVLWKLGLPADWAQANNAAIREATRLQPDVIWLEKGNVIWPKTLRTLKRLLPQAKLVSFSEDDMYALHNRSWYFRLGLRYYDLVVTTKSYNCHPDELPSFGPKKVIFIDNTYDEESHYPRNVTDAEARELGGDVGFIGTFEMERALDLLSLAQAGFSVRVRGTGRWHKLIGAHPNLDVKSAEVLGDDYAKAISATKINLCFLRKANRDVQTNRTMEIPACGGFMLGERTEEHCRLFAEGKEAEFFGNQQELARKVAYYLNHEEQRKAIAAAGSARCRRSGYSIQVQLPRLLAAIVG